MSFTLLTDRQPASQKAIGVQLLIKGALISTEGSAPRVPPTAFIPAAELLTLTPEELDSIEKQLAQLFPDHSNSNKFRLFVRPCPLVPRHGFVDSRVVMNLSMLKQVAVETVAAEPEGELLLMAPVVAKVSAVCTPGSIVMGFGNDGATQGHQPLLNINLKDDAMPFQVRSGYYQVSHYDADGKAYSTDEYNNLLKKLTAEEWEQFGIPHEEVPYIEIVRGVYDREAHVAHSPVHNFLVQVRAGPVTGDASLITMDYIPKATTVSQIFEPTEDALQFEKLADAAKGVEGAVCFHPGGCRISHYAAHCISRGIPVLFRMERPEIGERLQPSGEEPLRYSRHRFYQGVQLGWCAKPIGDVETDRFFGDWTKACIVLLHHSNTLATPFGSFALGWAIASFMRIALMLCVGEHRHKARIIHGKRSRKDRHQVYTQFVKAPFGPGQITRSVTTLKDFIEHDWGGGFGGPAWAECAAQALKLYDLLLEGSGVHDIIAKAHTLLNCAHNNGWMFNKITSEEEFNEVAEVNPWYTYTGAMLAMSQLKAGLELPRSIFNPDAKPLYVSKREAVSKRLTRHISKLGGRSLDKDEVVQLSAEQYIKKMVNESEAKLQIHAMDPSAMVGGVQQYAYHLQFGLKNNYLTMDFTYWKCEEGATPPSSELLPAWARLNDQQFELISSAAKSNFKTHSLSGNPTVYFTMLPGYFESYFPDQFNRLCELVDMRRKSGVTDFASMRSRYNKIVGDIFDIEAAVSEGGSDA